MARGKISLSSVPRPAGRPAAGAFHVLLGALVALPGCNGGNGAVTGNSTTSDGGGSTGAPDAGNAPLPEVPDNVAIAPAMPCTMAGIGAVRLTADAPVTILEVSSGSTGQTDAGPGDGGPDDKPYCLVKVRVDPQVNIWVALPTRSWNGRLRAEGGGKHKRTHQKCLSEGSRKTLVESSAAIHRWILLHNRG